MSFRVLLTPRAAQDLDRLYDFIIERESASDTPDPSNADRALQALRDGIATLRSSPFTCRKAGRSPFLRELVVSFGRAGYVVLFEIADGDTLIIAAVRHQREDDYR